MLDGTALYGQFPSRDRARRHLRPGLLRSPTRRSWRLWGFSGHWDDLPAAHAAAIFFDLLTIALLFLLGRRIRGPSTGVVLAYAWAAFPFTALALESNSNDALVAALILATLLVAGSPPARGAFAALAGLAKFAPLALVPLLATHRLRERGARGIVALRRRRSRSPPRWSPSRRWPTTRSRRSTRGPSPTRRTAAPRSRSGASTAACSTEQTIVQLFAIALAGALAVLPRRADLIGLCACSAAI